MIICPNISVNMAKKIEFPDAYSIYMHFELLMLFVIEDQHCQFHMLSNIIYFQLHICSLESAHGIQVCGIKDG